MRRFFLAFSAASGFFVFLELANRQVDYVIWWGLGSLIWAMGAALMVWSQKEKKLIILKLPFFIFLLSSSFFLLFLDRPVFRHFLIIISSILIFWYLIDSGEKRGQDEIKNKTEIILFFSLFFLISILSGWLTFLARQFWPVLLSIEVIFFLFFLSFFVWRGLSARPMILPALVASLFMGEFFWALNLLSLGFLTKSFLFTLSAIYLAFILNWRLQKNFSSRKFLVLTSIFGFLIIIILSSARWI